jgi:hypothetical protein
VEEAGKSQIANLDFAGACDHDVSRLQVTMHDPVPVEIDKALQELVEDRLDGACWNGLTLWLIVVMNDLQQVVLGIFKDNEDALFLENDLGCVHNIGVGEFSTQSHLSDGRLRDARILEFAFFVRLESEVISKVGCCV